MEEENNRELIIQRSSRMTKRKYDELVKSEVPVETNQQVFAHNAGIRVRT